MNDLSSINPADLNPFFSSNSAGLSSLGGGASFNSLVDQMLANPSTATPQNARLAFAEAQQADNLALGGMFADPSSSLGLAAAGLGGGDLFALPGWAYQAASLSGDPQIESLINLYNQESSLIQNQLMGGNSTGLLGGGSGLFDGLA
jgi:hypothetical protein